jgi:hypothetical protein
MKTTIDPSRVKSKNDDCSFNNVIAKEFGGLGLTHYICTVGIEGFKTETWTFHAANTNPKHIPSVYKGYAYSNYTGYAHIVFDHKNQTWDLEAVTSSNKHVKALQKAQKLISENDIQTNDRLIELQRARILPEAHEQAVALVQDATEKSDLILAAADKKRAALLTKSKEDAHKIIVESEKKAAEIIAKAEGYIPVDPVLISRVRENTIATFPSEISPMGRLQSILKLTGEFFEAVRRIMKDGIVAEVVRKEDIALHSIGKEPRHILTVHIDSDIVQATSGDDYQAALGNGLRQAPDTNIVYANSDALAKKPGRIDLHLARPTETEAPLQLGQSV